MKKHQLFGILIFVAEAAFGNPCTNFVGINVHAAQRPQIYQAVSEASFDWVRIDFNWKNIHEKNQETGADQFNWEATDTAVRLAKEQGLKIFATLAYAPPWARRSGCSNHNGCPPKSVLDWTRFVKEAVSRYSPKEGAQYNVDKWGVWNEPNLEEFWLGSMSEFVDLILVPGYQAIKEVNDKIDVIGPDLAFGKKYKWNQWLKHLVKKGIKAFDIFSFHVYANKHEDLDDDGKEDTDGDLVKILTDKVYSDLKSVGIFKADKKVWLTEFGWRTHDPKVVNQELQAQYIVGVLKKINDSRQNKGNLSWIKKIFVYSIADGKNEDLKDRWGLLEGKKNSFAPKTSYHAVKGFLTDLRKNCTQ